MSYGRLTERRRGEQSPVFKGKVEPGICRPRVVDGSLSWQFLALWRSVGLQSSSVQQQEGTCWRTKTAILHCTYRCSIVLRNSCWLCEPARASADRGRAESKGIRILVDFTASKDTAQESTHRQLEALPARETRAGRRSVAHRVGRGIALALQAEEDLLHPAEVTRPFCGRLAPAVLQLNHLCNALPGCAPPEGIVACLDKRSLILLVLRNLLLLLLVVVGVEVVYRLFGFADNLLLARS